MSNMSCAKSEEPLERNAASIRQNNSLPMNIACVVRLEIMITLSKHQLLLNRMQRKLLLDILGQSGHQFPD
jgi:hypothetical protein